MYKVDVILFFYQLVVENYLLVFIVIIFFGFEFQDREVYLVVLVRYVFYFYNVNSLGQFIFWVLFFVVIYVQGDV